MNQLTDQKYLKEQQYRSADNLQARIALHTRFGTNPYPWYSWVFDRLNLQPESRLLEVGCGPGSLWKHNQHRLPEDIQLVLADLSLGMVSEARNNNGDRPAFRFLNLDTQQIPFPNAAFDMVVANHMLYHVPDLQQAAGDIARVLRPGGKLFAATNGLQHMHELHELIQEFFPGCQRPLSELRQFSLESAESVLRPAFDQVEIHIFEDNLVVTEVEPLVAYVFSMSAVFGGLTPDQAASFESLARSRFDAGGTFRITKSQGLVIAY